MAFAVLMLVALCIAYFVSATAVGVYTGYDPFQSSTPRFYRVFLWVAAKAWNAILPGIGGLD